ncbi:MAG: hypothetical protein AAGH15_15975 [Myxococcota bacterium]
MRLSFVWLGLGLALGLAAFAEAQGAGHLPPPPPRTAPAVVPPATSVGFAPPPREAEPVALPWGRRSRLTVIAKPLSPGQILFLDRELFREKRVARGLLGGAYVGYGIFGAGMMAYVVTVLTWQLTDRQRTIGNSLLLTGATVFLVHTIALLRRSRRLQNGLLAHDVPVRRWRRFLAVALLFPGVPAPASPAFAYRHHRRMTQQMRELIRLRGATPTAW